MIKRTKVVPYMCRKMCEMCGEEMKNTGGVSRGWSTSWSYQCKCGYRDTEDLCYPSVKYFEEEQ